MVLTCNFVDNRLYKETPKPAPVKKTTNKRKRRTVTPARKSSRRSTRSTDTKEEPVEEEEEEVGSEEEGEWVPWKLVIFQANYPASLVI